MSDFVAVGASRYDADMGFRVEVDVDQQIVESFWEGAVDEAQLRRYVDEAWTDPARRGYDELIDFSEVSDVEAPFAAIQAIAEYSRQFDNPEIAARTALVAPTALIYGLSRMFASLRESDESENRQFEVF
ncbi:MAG: hypothetical protein AAF387_13035, partial [Pseudomonadota bacterium]